MKTPIYDGNDGVLDRQAVKLRLPMQPEHPEFFQDLLLDNESFPEDMVGVIGKFVAANELTLVGRVSLMPRS